MKHIIHANFMFNLGGQETAEFLFPASIFSFKPDILYAGAPLHPGAFLLEHAGAVIDLSIAARHTLPLSWPLIERGQELKLKVRHVGWIPPGYCCGANITITLSVAGERA